MYEALVWLTGCLTALLPFLQVDYVICCVLKRSFDLPSFPLVLKLLWGYS